MLTETETKLIRTGFRHMVDNGYGKLESAADLLKVLEVHLETAKRERIISHQTFGAEAMEDPRINGQISYLEAIIQSVEGRVRG